MFWKKKRKIDLSRAAFCNGKREITYGQFSNDIGALETYFQKNLPTPCPIIGISDQLGPYLHWVVYAVCTMRGIPTLAIRPSQLLPKNTVTVGSVSSDYDGANVALDYSILSEARNSTPDDKGKNFDKFVRALTSKKEITNRILLTSGSTGTPKAVPLTNRNIMARYELGVAQLPLNADDQVLWSLGYDTAGGFNGPIEVLLTGGTVLFQLRGSGSEVFAQLLRRSTRFVTVPSILAVILEHLSEPIDGASKRIIMTTGSRLEPSIAERSRALLGADTRSFFGSTELGAVSEVVGEAIQSEPGNVGKLYPGVQLDVSDVAEDDSAHSENDMSRSRKLRFRSPWMAAGYWEDGAITPFEGGWFSSGDMGYLNEHGELIITGRDDDVLNFNGLKFDALSIESKLKSADVIEDAFLTVIKFEGVDRLVVMVVSELEQGQLQAYLSSVLTRYKFDVVHVKRIPRNHMGKLERPQLTQYCADVLSEQLNRRSKAL